MAEDRPSKDAILQRLQGTLQAVRFGLTLLQQQGGPQKLAGLRNVIVFGRAVTNVLQNLRSVDDRFDAWYQPFRKEMESDPLMRYLYTLRSQILKEGALPTGMTICIRELQLPRDMARFGPPPPGAKGLFIGDSTGGSGWNVELPAGRIEKYYAEMPGDIGAVWVRLPEASLTSGSKYRIRGSRRFVNCTSSI